jgi:hypothetical protein
MPYGGKKKGADGGVDGFLYFKVDSKTTEKGIVSVKGGENVDVKMVRELANVVDSQKAKIGVLDHARRAKKDDGDLGGTTQRSRRPRRRPDGTRRANSSKLLPNPRAIRARTGEPHISAAASVRGT